MKALHRRYMIHVCKDGTISYRDTAANEPVFNGVALPVFSVNTEKEAKAIQAMFGRLCYFPHPKQPDRPRYRLASLGDGRPLDRLLEIEDLDVITRIFTEFYTKEYPG